MESTRQQKVARLLQKELAELIQRDYSGLFHGKMVTITVVRVSPDLSVARVYLSVFPSTARAEILQLMDEHKSGIRNQLGRKVRHQLRIVPELAFFVDDSLDYVEHIDNLLKK